MNRPNDIYLAVPYTHKSIRVQQYRKDEVTRLYAHLLTLGYHVISPITMGEAAEKYLPKRMATDLDFWQFHNHALMDSCKDIWVLQLPEWEESNGIEDELSYAQSHGMPCRFIPYLWGVDYFSNDAGFKIPKSVDAVNEVD